MAERSNPIESGEYNNIEEKIKDVTTFDELYKVLREMGNIEEPTGGSYTAQEVIDIIEHCKSNQEPKKLPKAIGLYTHEMTGDWFKIPGHGSLRRKVVELYVKGGGKIKKDEGGSTFL